LPDNIEQIGPRSYLITSYTPQKALLISFDSGSGRFRLLHSFCYPYGRTAIDNSLNSFFNFGQFADNRLHLSKIKKVSDREILVSDLLSARVLLVELNR
jgi:hypothetical protein